MTQPDTRDGQSLASRTPAGATETENLSIDSDGTVERLTLRIYRGAETDLRLYPRIVREGNSIPLIETAGKTYIDGDDDHWEWTLAQPVQQGDRLSIRAVNNDDTNPHNWRATVEVDYLEGQSRVLSSIRSAIGGVL